MRKNVLLLTACLLFISIGLTGMVSAEKGRSEYEKTGEVVWDINTKDKIVALTFDDGPHPKYTSKVLDILAKYEAKGTFFIIGQNAEKYPDLVLRTYKEGHELANHTYSHLYKVAPSKLQEELQQTNQIIHDITGFSPVLFRPVGGNYNDKLINTAVKSGYKVVMWSWHQDTQDWKEPGTNKIVQKVLGGTKPGDVILFHDGGGNRTQTIEALEEIIPTLKKQGYTFVTVSELIERKQQQEQIQ